MKQTFDRQAIPNIAKELHEVFSQGRQTRSATVVALSGELGAGKTTLTQAIARELGIIERLVSPTFVIMKLYPIPRGEWKQLVHIDAYRLNTVEELYKIGWDAIVSDPENLILVEWPEKVPDAIPAKSVRVRLSHEDNEQRSIECVIG